jgi:putative tricarboxylic transport membrane protein
VPTLRESGMDVELQNWRGVVAPKGISEEQERTLENLLVDMTKTDAWRNALAEQGWGDATLAGEEFEDFVRTEQDRVSRVLDEIGLG